MCDQIRIYTSELANHILHWLGVGFTNRNVRTSDGFRIHFITCLSVIFYIILQKLSNELSCILCSYHDCEILKKLVNELFSKLWSEALRPKWPRIQHPVGNNGRFFLLATVLEIVSAWRFGCGLKYEMIANSCTRHLVLGKQYILASASGFANLPET